MAGNTFGTNFKVTTCGESHGKALMAIVDGTPPLIEISEDLYKRISTDVVQALLNMARHAMSQIRFALSLVCLRAEPQVRL